MANNVYNSEWLFLQGQFESYEKHSLYIKLISIGTLLLSELFAIKTIAILMLLLVLWLQDAIWKTFQSRIEPRLFQLEKLMQTKEQDGTQSGAFQFNSDYEKRRLSGIALIGEYVSQALRPTIAFPHVVLVAIMVWQCLSNT